MIGSLMSRMGDAQKLSVPQLQQAIKDGTLPAYVGIPIIQDKMRQIKGAAQPVAPKTPIAQEILQEARQPQAGVEALPSNLPTESMAGGGIVAFADGGLNDEEEYEQAIEDEEFDRYQNLLDNASHYVKAEDTSAPPSKHTENRGVGINPNTTGGMGLKDLLAAKAAAHKLPPQLLSAIAGLESGGKETAANPRSSAKGLFQFTDATWKGMGGKEGEQFNPERNAELGAMFTRQNAEGLKKSLGRDPTYGEVYAAHHFGLKGAKDLMNADPKTPIEMAVSSSVIKANPYLKDKTVGQVLADLNKKTGNGTVALADGGIAAAAPYYGMAAGGEVQHYDVGGGIDTLGAELDALRSGTKTLEEASIAGGSKRPAAPEILEGLANAKKLRDAKEKEYMAALEEKGVNKTAFMPQYSMQPKRPEANPTVAAMSAVPPVVASPAAPTVNTSTVTNNKPTDQEFKDFDQAAALFEAEQKNKTAPVGIDTANVSKTSGIEQVAPKTAYDELIEKLNKREAGNAKQKSIDNYMALLSAGLGMMGGTSPHALANIGQGAMAGIQNLSESNKLRAAEQANLDKTMATAIRYKEAQKAAEQGKQGQMALEYAKLGETQKTHIANIMGNREKMAQAQAKLYLDKNPIAGMDANDPAAVQDMANKILARDPAYLKAYNAYNGFAFELPSSNQFTDKQNALLNKYKP
jgi:Transglycosylase SLT domain